MHIHVIQEVFELYINKAIFILNWKGFVGSCKVNKFFEKKEKKLFLTLGPVARELAVATVFEVCFGELQGFTSVFTSSMGPPN